MFIIECENDGSLMSMDDEGVAYDENVQPGDTVFFFYRGKKCKGSVHLHSADEKLIQSTLKSLRKLKPGNTKKITDDIPLSKRISKKKVPYTPGCSNTKVPKSKKRKLQKDDEQSSEVDKDTLAIINQSTKRHIASLNKSTKSLSSAEESEDDSFHETSRIEKFKAIQKASEIEKLKTLKSKKAGAAQEDFDIEKEKNFIEGQKHGILSKKLLKQQNIDIGSSESDTEEDGGFGDPTSGGSSVSSKGAITDDLRANQKNDDIENVDPAQETLPEDKKFLIELPGKFGGSEQLYGKTWENEKMAHLGEGIYCRPKFYEEAQHGRTATSVALRLLEGVFKREALLESTPTGQTGRGLGKEAAKLQNMNCLNKRALDVIIEFALLYAKNEKFTVGKTGPQIRTAITNRLGAMRRAEKKNLAFLINHE